MESMRSVPGMSQAIEEHLPLSLSSLFVFTDYMRSYWKLEIAISKVLFFSQPFCLSDKSGFQSCSFFLQHYKCLFYSSAICLGSLCFKILYLYTVCMFSYILFNSLIRFSIICVNISEFIVNHSSQSYSTFALE